MVGIIHLRIILVFLSVAVRIMDKLLLCIFIKTTLASQQLMLITHTWFMCRSKIIECYHMRSVFISENERYGITKNTAHPICHQKLLEFEICDEKN